MSDDPPRPLDLNGLDRYRKRSPDLTLETYSSCEVPAGCGGMILRYRDLRDRLPLHLHVLAPEPFQVLIDGEPCEATSPDLTIGRHTLTIHLPEPLTEPDIILVAGCNDPDLVGGEWDPAARRLRALPPFTPTVFRTQDDDTWLYRTTPPPPEWFLPDDTSGKPLAYSPTPPTPPDTDYSRRSYLLRRLLPLRARALQLPVAPQLWIRASFTLCGYVEYP